MVPQLGAGYKKLSSELNKIGLKLAPHKCELLVRAGNEAEGDTLALALGIKRVEGGVLRCWALLWGRCCNVLQFQADSEKEFFRGRWTA